MTQINFYRVWDEYGCFSNFSLHPIMLGGKEWKTTEHYFQAQKFIGTEREEEIRKASSPRIAADMGRDRSFLLRSDWETVKDHIMVVAVRAKFTQHPEIAATLLSTGDAVLVEHTANDAYWGDGGDGTGKNMLGQILMRVRNELRSVTTNG